ncbi:MAG: TlpA disulfide reductase family protein [Candidatus Margulisiibacteriota bacterium]
MKRFLIVASILMTMAMGQVIPDFQLINLQKKTLKLHSVISQNRYTLVSLVSLTCGYCMQEMTDYGKLSEQYISRNVGFMVIFTEDNPSAIASLVHQKGLRFPTYMGGEAFARAFRVRGVPYTVVVDRAGQIIRVIPGYVELEQMTKLIQGLLDSSTHL